MKLPEFTLFLGGKGGLGGGFGHFMEFQGHVFKDQFDGLRIFFQHLVEQGQDFAAVRTLEVGE